MKRISNFAIFITVFCILLGIVITKTVIVLNEQHEEKLMYAMNTKIEYNAKRCFLEGKCKGKITLNTLYDKKYLDTVVNPITKEILDASTEIEFIDNKIIIYWKNMD